MLTPWETLSRLSETSGRLDKEAIIQLVAKQGNDVFFEGCRAALDSMVTFGLKQIPEKQNEDGTGLDWAEFTSITRRLADRSLTGNSARDAVNELMNKATRPQWNGWYRLILIKDLRCGVSEKTINKVVEKINAKYAIPVFSCQLSHDSANHESKVTGKKLIEVKLDGVRVITIVYPSGHVDQFSRNGKELANFEHVKSQLSTVASSFQEPMVLDGEIMSSSFQDLMKQVHRKENVEANDAVLNVFDILTLEQFNNGGVGSAKQSCRSETLRLWYESVKDKLPNVSILSHEEVDLDTEKGMSKFKEINAKAIAGGYEGIMIKDPNATYECKRTVAWLKLKPFIEVSLNVESVEEGTGKNVGRLGAFVCSGQDDGKQITVNVGSGFSDRQRDEFWYAHISSNEIVGQVVEVRADAITKNQDGTYSLRFPRFLRFRGFVAGQKI